MGIPADGSSNLSAPTNGDNMKVENVKIKMPRDANVILLTTHFIKSVEDLHEILITSVPNIRFGLGFCEASGPCLVRKSGNDPELVKAASEEALKIGCGHSVIIFLKNAYPINVLNQIKNMQEVCTVHCATANPIEVIVADTEEGRGILGVIDGSKPKGIEKEQDVTDRKVFLRKIGYKL